MTCRSGTRCRSLQKKLFARQAEVFAGYTAYTDYEIGRVIQAVEDMGKLDNTLIIYIDGDNGTSPEGTLSGTPNQYTAYNGILDVPEPPAAAASTRTGARRRPTRTWRSHGPGRSTRRSSGPSRWPRTSAGRGRAWPSRGPATSRTSGGIRNQFHHVIDIVPTILEATGIKAPEMVDGIKQKPIEGVSMAYTFDKANANAPSTRKTQYFEMIANRGIYHEGWYANTTPPVAPWVLNAKMPDVDDYKWELYNLDRGLLPGQRSRGEDAGQAEGDAGAVRSRRRPSTTCLPLDNSQFQRAIAPRPSAIAGTDRLHLLRREPRHSARQRAEHPEQVVHDHRRDRGPAGRRRRHDRHRRRPLRRLRPVPAQGQAGLRLQPPRSQADPLGRRRGQPRLDGRFAQAGQAHDRVRLHVRRPRHREGRHPAC